MKVNLSKCGCCKHVFTEHGWYYYSEEKPDVAKVFPEIIICTNNYQFPKQMKAVIHPRS